MKKIKHKKSFFVILIIFLLLGIKVNLTNAEKSICDLDCQYKATKIPNDQYYNEQWYLEKIKAPNAWNKITSAHEVVIAIIDGGIQTNHPDLEENIWRNNDEIADNNIDDDNNGFIDDIIGWNFIENNPKPIPNIENQYNSDELVHGTVVSGIAAAIGDNNKGVTGVAWRSKIMALKVLNEKGEGEARDVIKAIDYAIANNADIINFSFVGEGYSKSLEDAISRAYRAGIVMVAAAGNEQTKGHGYFLNKTPLYPVCHDGNNGENMIIGVAATDTLDQKAYFSSYGNCVDISAPGVSIYTTSINLGQNSILNKDYDGYWSGTSMATPMVSATVALMKQANPKLSREEILRTLQVSSDNIDKLNPDYIDFLGSGRLNVYESVNNAGLLLEKLSPKLLFSNFSKGDKVILTDGLGRVENQFFAFDNKFNGGVNISSGDIDSNDNEEIIVGAGNSGGPQVRIFNNQGKLQGQFFAYDKNFRGGVNVAVGDISGDNIAEIVTSAGVGGGPQVRIFNNKGEVLGQFFAYDKNFRGGINLALADIVGNTRKTKKEIITAPFSNGGPHIRVFDNFGMLQEQFFAYDKNFRGGVSVSGIDINSDGLDEIICGAGKGGSPHIRIFKGNGRQISSFYAFDEDFRGGVNVSGIKF